LVHGARRKASAGQLGAVGRIVIMVLYRLVGATPMQLLDPMERVVTNRIPARNWLVKGEREQIHAGSNGPVEPQ